MEKLKQLVVPHHRLVYITLILLLVGVFQMNLKIGFQSETKNFTLDLAPRISGDDKKSKIEVD